MKKSKAFTLIEMLVVIAIIALLLAILMPTLKMAKEHGKRLLCANNLKTIGSAVYLYAEEHDGYIPPTRYAERDAWFDAPHVTYYMLYIDVVNATLSPHERIQKAREDHFFEGSNWINTGVRFTNLGYIIKEEALPVESGKVFYCASNGDKAFSYNQYGGQQDWPMPDLDRTAGPEWILSSYSYAPQHRLKTVDIQGKKYPAPALKLADMNPALSVALDVMQARDKFGHKSSSYIGVNMLYGDGSVSFRRDESLEEFYRKGGELYQDASLYREILRNLEN